MNSKPDGIYTLGTWERDIVDCRWHVSELGPGTNASAHDMV